MSPLSQARAPHGLFPGALTPALTMTLPSCREDALYFFLAWPLAVLFPLGEAGLSLSC
jgi:hypothetical protein